MSTVVLVTGVGRSGTSLAVQALERLGAALPDDLVGASPQNARGAFEDPAILDVHRRLAGELGLNRNVPRPDDWLDHPATTGAANLLEEHVAQLLARAPATPLALKDPWAAAFLPLWRRVLHALKAELRVVVCTRDAAAILRSLRQNYGQSAATAEGRYLLRTYYTLVDLGGDGFYLPYADWRADAAGLVTELAAFAGLPATVAADALFAPELDHQQVAGAAAPGGLVAAFDAALAGRRGPAPDLADAAAACRAVEHLFADGAFLVESARAAAAAATDGGAGGAARPSRLAVTPARKALEAEKRELEKRAQAAERLKERLAEVEQTRDATETRLRAELAKLRHERQRVRSDAREADQLRRTLRWRLGDAICAAFEKPGWRTLRLPWRILRVLAGAR